MYAFLILLTVLLLALADDCGPSGSKVATSETKQTNAATSNAATSNAATSNASPAAGAANARPQSGQTSTPSTANEMSENKGVVVVSGIFDAAGENLLSLKPVRRYRWRSRPVPEQPQGRFVVKVEYEGGGETLVPFDALVADDAGRTRHGFFEVIVPLAGEPKSVRITDAGGGKEFSLVKASEFQQ